MSSHTKSFLAGPFGPICVRTARLINFVTRLGAMACLALPGLVLARFARSLPLRWGPITPDWEVRA